MRINSKSTRKLDGDRNVVPVANRLGVSLERLSSGYRVNRAGDGVAVLRSRTSDVDKSNLPQIIRSAGAPPALRAV